MTREQLEHILRASAAITGQDQFVIVGSQAILGQFPDAPAELRVSNEADVFSLIDANAAELIDGSIGDTTALAHALTSLAGALTLAGESERAARLFGAAEALRERTGLGLHVAAETSAPGTRADDGDGDRGGRFGGHASSGEGGKET